MTLHGGSSVKDAYCHACGNKGHIACACKTVPRWNSSPLQICKKPSRLKLNMKRDHDNQETTETGSSSEQYTVHNIVRYFNDPVYVQMLTNGKRLSMEVDTGAKVSIILE